MKILFGTLTVSALFLATSQVHAGSGSSFWREQVPSDSSRPVETISVGKGGASWFLQEIVKNSFPGKAQEEATTSTDSLMVSQNGSKNWFFRAIAPSQYTPAGAELLARRAAAGK